MAPRGRRIEQRHQDKGARVQLRVRQYQPAALAVVRRPANPPAAHIQDVDVECTWRH
jgi:hypothetical protein